MSLFRGLNLDGHTLRHHAWMIVFIVSLAQMLGAAVRMAFGVLINPLEDTFAWSPGAVGFAYALMSITSAIIAPIAGIFSSQFGIKRTVLLGVILFFIGMMWTSQVRYLWEFYLAYGVVFGASQSLFLVPAVPAIANWFRRHLGLAMGVAIGSWSLGPAILVPIMAFLFEAYGWSQTMIIVGVGGTLVLCLVMPWLKNTPEDAGKVAYGQLSGDKELLSKGTEFQEQSKRYQGAMYRTNAFWHLVNIHFLGCVGHAVILVGIVPMAVHKGMSFPAAAGVLTVIAAVSLLSRFLAPILGEKFNTKGTMFWAFLGQGLFVLLLLSADSAWEFYLFAVLWAVPYGGEGPVFPIINRRYYGFAPMGPTHGWQMLGGGLGMAFGGVLPGFLFDTLGSYTWAIWVSAIFSIAGAFVILILSPTKELLIPRWSNRA